MCNTPKEYYIGGEYMDIILGLRSVRGPQKSDATWLIQWLHNGAQSFSLSSCGGG